jgi:tetratricopeptide (TPR) repeat protein
MKKTIFSIILFSITIIFNVGLLAQIEGRSNSFREFRLFRRAMLYAGHDNYAEAIKLFKEILELDSNDLNALFNLGLCYLNSTNGADTAVMYFNKGIDVLSDEEKKGYLGREFSMSLGKAYQVLLRPKSAIAIYGQVKDNLSSGDSVLLRDVEREVKICRNAHYFINNPIDITIENMGSGVNSMYDDHSPLVAVGMNRLFFTSRRNWLRLSLLPDGQYAEKVYSVPLGSNNWESARMVKVFFKQNEHESAVSLSPDGNEMVLYRNDVHGKSLYLSHFDGQMWASPEKLPYPINSYSEETHGSISPDGSTFFFTSDREGGFGGLDIYMVQRDEKGKWGNPINLGPNINTPYDEETPMMHYDGKTLYFSSEGHNSMGQLDVFYSYMKVDSTWSNPVNMGYPINTPDDDFFFMPTIDKSYAYYASSRFEDNYGGSDIYYVKFNTGESISLAVIEGEFEKSTGENFNNVQIKVVRKNDNDIVGQYRPSKYNGKYMMFLEPGNDYEVTEFVSGKIKSVLHLHITDQMSYGNIKRSVRLSEAIVN